MPRALMRRYVTAASRTAPSPPSNDASGRASSATAAASGTPMAMLSHRPWTATAAPARGSPRPTRKATRLVVP
jgi:hypothetical protein